ncbi:MAG: NADH-quinone oxidoreductase subunit J [Bacteroidales bacterium]|nr:NADH-quinone oxidoreductase subunit J [Bacteroidales bacterium]NCA76822.1 NADH-quinone oxidoreductase subunit J [Alphaproteobacteria bacterium]HNW73459.1 NADH-quinone oxidoreductase subunit J [Bacteroidales bacterium]HPS51405.1 NADH-quinone oxidoreductase subunit J [Bacteroidales bacterium]
MLFTRYLFYFLTILALFSATMVLASRKPIHSVLFLTLTFFAIAGHYILLNAQFLAVVHIIVYAGAIMVLFLFTVMLLNLNKDERSPKPAWVKIMAVIAGGMLMLTLIGVFRGYEGMTTADPSLTQIGLVKNLGRVLYHDYLLPFELSSILFLTAMVGAVLLGKKEQI